LNTRELVPIARSLLDQHGIDLDLAGDLGNILARCPIQDLKPDDVLCREGDPGDDLFILVAGRVMIRMRDFLGVDRQVAIIKAPALFGHMSLVDDVPRSATCIADGDGVVAVMGHRRFGSLLRDIGPDGDVFRRLLLSSMSQQLSRGNQEIRAMIHDIRSASAAMDDVDDVDESDLLRARGAYKGWRR